MSKRQSLQAMFFIASLFVSSLAAAHAADKCLAKPSGPPPRGKHWYYHYINKRMCWYLHEAGLPVSRHDPEKTLRPAAKSSAQEAPAPQPERVRPMRAQPWAADTPSGALSEDNASANASQARWPDVAASSRKPDFVWPSPPAPPFAAQSASADDTPPVGSANASEVGDPSPTADDHPATSAIGPQPPEHERAPASPQAPVPQVAAPIKAAEGYYVLTLFMLLVVGLAIGGTLHVVVRRQRLRSADAFRPPVWARVVPLNASIPRVRLREPVARAQAPEERLAVLPPADHTEQLARALQELVDRLRARPDAAPGIVPDAARRSRLCHDSEPAPQTGRSPANSFAADQGRWFSREVPHAVN